MSPHLLETLRSGSANADVISLDLRKLEAERRSVADKVADASEASARADRDQLAREIADIERAILALRKAEPRLQPWTKPQATGPDNPRPVWLVLAALWLLAALITTGAVVAIAAIAG